MRLLERRLVHESAEKLLEKLRVSDRDSSTGCRTALPSRTLQDVIQPRLLGRAICSVIRLFYWLQLDVSLGKWLKSGRNRSVSCMRVRRGRTASLKKFTSELLFFSYVKYVTWLYHAMRNKYFWLILETRNVVFPS